MHRTMGILVFALATKGGWPVLLVRSVGVSKTGEESRLRRDSSRWGCLRIQVKLRDHHIRAA